MTRPRTTIVPMRDAPPPRTPSRPVLVVAHPDGFLEIFGDGVDVHVMEMLSGTDETEVLRERYLFLRTPRRYRDLHRADRLVKTAILRPRTAEQEAQRLLELNLVRACKEQR